MKKKEKQILKAAALPAGAFAALAFSGSPIFAEEIPVAVNLPADIQPAPDSVEDVTNTDVVLPESNASAIEEQEAAATADPAQILVSDFGNEEPGSEIEPIEAVPVQTEAETYTTPAAETEADVITGDREAAVSQVSIPKYDEEGNLHKEELSQWVIDRLDAPISAEKTIDGDREVLKVNFQIKDVFLGDEAKNGLGGSDSTTGKGYANMSNYYIQVLQAKALLEQNKGAKMLDSEGNEVDLDYLNSLTGLLEQISLFDPTTDLKYIWPDAGSLADSASRPADTCNVLATSSDGKASFRFHIDSHGWWGYELVGDTLMNQIMKPTDTDGNALEGDARSVNNQLASKYGNYFVIQMSDDDLGKWYILKDTDLEAPYLFVSKDQTKAALIDTDFYGENVLNRILRSVIPNTVTELKILLTHNHPDHANNLAVIARDPWLKSIAEICWPEGESHTRVNGTDVVALFDNIHYMKDMDEFQAGGTGFQFIQIPNEHTQMGGAFADLGRSSFFSGDTLGAQIHLGGTNVNTAQLDSWIDGVTKIVNYIEEHGMPYNFGGHSNYACSSEFASWMLTALEEAKVNLEKDPNWATGRGALVIVENNEIISPERTGEMMKNSLSDTEELNVLSVNFRNSTVTDTLTGDRDAAIAQVAVPKVDEDGKLHKEALSQWVIDRLDDPISVTRKTTGQNKILQLGFQVKDVFLGDEAKNGLGGEASTTGRSYVNMCNYYVQVLQAKALLEQNEGAKMLDSEGNEVDLDYLNSLADLLEQISLFNPTTDLKYIWPGSEAKTRSITKPAGTCDVLATSRDGKASFRFHIDSHGWWGYELAGDTLMSQIMNPTDTDGNVIEGDARSVNSQLATKYGNFFVILMNDDELGKWYILQDTDLEAPYLFISRDGTKAALIDTDFYGENVLNSVLKSVLPDTVEELKIMITHNHGDHANNLAVIAKDPWLKSIAEIYWPEDEVHTKVNGTDVAALFDKVHDVKDMETFDAGGTQFQFLQIPNEHTPKGGAFADVNRKNFYSGDTLGAQIHLGGTTVNAVNLDSWINGVTKIVSYIDENGIPYNFGGHTNYASDSQFANWMLTALKEAKVNLENDPNWAGLIIVENSEVVSPERAAEMFANGLSDNEELVVLSANFRNPVRPADPSEDQKPADDQKDPAASAPETGKDGSHQTAAESPKKLNVVKTERSAGSASAEAAAPVRENTPATAAGFEAVPTAATGLLAAIGAFLFRRRNRK